MCVYLDARCDMVFFEALNLNLYIYHNVKLKMTKSSSEFIRIKNQLKWLRSLFIITLILVMIYVYISTTLKWNQKL